MKILNLEQQNILNWINNIWAQRLSYVGELGYELYISNKNAKEIYDLIVETGKRF